MLSLGGTTMLERSLTVLREVFQQVSLVIAEELPLVVTEIPVWRDLIPHQGSLGGIYTGIRLAQTPYIFVGACDMPFLNAGLIRYLVSLKDGMDIVMPRWEKNLHPTHAVYGRQCVLAMEEMMRSGHLSIRDLVLAGTLRVRWVEQPELSQFDPEGWSFFNVNTPDDFERARQRAMRVGSNGGRKK
ncbi:MAG: molybdenum cofactor guanylyltransferase [Nitrospira sp.]|nr:molybdenum cofactor guanylyltransferase [Nitrospira sp.]